MSQLHWWLGTAIGSAIGLAVSNLDKSEAKSKVIILLTDGQNNHGNLDPITAAQVAKEYGIRVYTIGAGSTGQAVTARRSILGTFATQSAPIDEASLRRIAETTGAKYYRASDTASLHEAFEEINQLERTEIELGDVYDYEDGFLPYASLGAAAAVASVLSRRFWFETIP